MLNKLRNTFITTSIKTSPLELVIWFYYQAKTSNYRAFADLNYGLLAPFE